MCATVLIPVVMELNYFYFETVIYTEFYTLIYEFS